MERVADDPATSSAKPPGASADIPADDPAGLLRLVATLDAEINRQAALAARSEEVHRALVSVVLDGGDLSDLAAELATILRGPVLVTTPDGRVVAQAGDGEVIADLVTSPAFDPYGRFRVETAPARGSVPPPGEGHCAVVPIVAGRVDHGRIVTFSTDPISDAD